MEDLLLDPCLDMDLRPSVVQELALFRQELVELRAEVSRLRRENLELRQQAGYWQSRHADAMRRIAALEQENEYLRGENRKLQAEQFGRKSEKQSGKDRSNQLDDPSETKPKRPRGQQRDRPGAQHRDRRERGRGIIGQVLVERRVVDERRRDQQQRVAIGRRARRDDARADERQRGQGDGENQYPDLVSSLPFL